MPLAILRALMMNIITIIAIIITLITAILITILITTSITIIITIISTTTITTARQAIWAALEEAQLAPWVRQRVPRVEVGLLRGPYEP